MLKEGCLGYMASVIKRPNEEIVPRDVLVLQKFEYMFLEDLPSLPLDRELEFFIELLP